MKVLLATQKPFSAKAVEAIKDVILKAGYEFLLLEKYAGAEDLIQAVENVDALIIRSDIVDQKVLEAGKNLKIVVRAGAGVDNVDLNFAKSKSVVVMNTPGQNSNAVAELVIAMMIYMSRKQFTPGTGEEILGKTVGLQAFGNVAKLVARKAIALGMKAVAYDPFVTKEDMQAESVEYVDNLEDLYKVSDFLSLHIPATPKTIASINYDLISKLPKSACLINTARKEVINEAELEKVLRERSDLMYVSDVAPSNYEDLKNEFGLRVFATSKKMGAQTSQANVNAGIAAAVQIVNFFEKGDVKFQVNK